MPAKRKASGSAAESPAPKRNTRATTPSADGPARATRSSVRAGTAAQEESSAVDNAAPTTRKRSNSTAPSAASSAEGDSKPRIVKSCKILLTPSVVESLIAKLQDGTTTPKKLTKTQLEAVVVQLLDRNTEETQRPSSQKSPQHTHPQQRLSMSSIQQIAEMTPPTPPVRSPPHSISRVNTGRDARRYLTITKPAQEEAERVKKEAAQEAQMKKEAAQEAHKKKEAAQEAEKKKTAAQEAQKEKTEKVTVTEPQNTEQAAGTAIQRQDASTEEDKDESLSEPARSRSSWSLKDLITSPLKRWGLLSPIPEEPSGLRSTGRKRKVEALDAEVVANERQPKRTKASSPSVAASPAAPETPAPAETPAPPPAETPTPATTTARPSNRRIPIARRLAAARRARMSPIPQARVATVTDASPSPPAPLTTPTPVEKRPSRPTALAPPTPVEKSPSPPAPSPAVEPPATTLAVEAESKKRKRVKVDDLKTIPSHRPGQSSNTFCFLPEFFDYGEDSVEWDEDELDIGTPEEGRPTKIARTEANIFDTPTPATPEAPAVTSAVSRKRSEAERYKPTVGSRLREVQRISTGSSANNSPTPGSMMSLDGSSYGANETHLEPITEASAETSRQTSPSPAEHTHVTPAPISAVQDPATPTVAQSSNHLDSKERKRLETNLQLAIAGGAPPHVIAHARAMLAGTVPASDSSNLFPTTTTTSSSIVPASALDDLPDFTPEDLARAGDKFARGLEVFLEQERLKDAGEPYDRDYSAFYPEYRGLPEPAS